ncbi:Piso0_002667 [Millerozyma farinosa CBS 7064]|uniref:Piso0_002667 protein n=1 Tax=Pichia sorbitophila (strain ATCC MYA-4447 / BCRC 22081 / CBS 7064 / NBRC 10061 / NRRL Y-12695) TaxID=559304 RepID=G8YFN0_PICSO|nr:Piso0_002667 [Millerozyma farinosa CBS 7064]
MDRHGIRAHSKLTRKLPSAFLIDWDETITKGDTIHLVAEASNATKKRDPPFEYYVSVYNRAYDDYKQEFLTKRGEVNSIEKEMDFQRGMKKVEMSSVNELCKLKFFEGLTVQNLVAQSSKVSLRENFLDFLGKCRLYNVPVIILSVNWTKLIMESVLRSHGFSEDSMDIQYIVNELEFSGGVCTGVFDSSRSVRTGIDKLEYLVKVRSTLGDVCYIGDSSTDIPCLVNSDAGIVMENGSAIKSLQKINVSLSSLSQFDTLEKDVVYYGNWHDISAHFFKNHLDTKKTD